MIEEIYRFHVNDEIPARRVKRSRINKDIYVIQSYLFNIQRIGRYKEPKNRRNLEQFIEAAKQNSALGIKADEQFKNNGIVRLHPKR